MIFVTVISRPMRRMRDPHAKLGSDYYLRQSDGGTKIARFGSKPCFSRNFIIVQKRIPARNLKDTLNGQKTSYGGLKKYVFYNNAFVTKNIFFWKVSPSYGTGPGLYGPIWALKEPIWARKLPKNTYKKTLYEGPLRGLSPCLK